MSKVLEAVGYGFAGGCIVGGAKAIGTFIPGAWIVTGAVAGGSIGYQVSGENLIAGAVGVGLGATLGTIETLAWPVTAPLNLMQSAAMPFLVSAVAGWEEYRKNQKRQRGW